MFRPSSFFSDSQAERLEVGNDVITACSTSYDMSKTHAETEFDPYTLSGTLEAML